MGEESATIGASISASCIFESAELSVSATTSVSEATTYSLSKTVTTSITATCAQQQGQTAWLYQWAVYVDGAHARSQNYRCHYTAGEPAAPQCPFGFCGNDNPLCQKSKCSDWQYHGSFAD